jgi:hypothetical protein
VNILIKVDLIRDFLCFLKIKQINAFVFLFTFILNVASLDAKSHNSGSESKQFLNGWKADQLLSPSPRKPARTAVLIIAPPVMGDCFVSNWWKIGKKTWEQYMNSHPNVDCYFLVSVNPRVDRPSTDQVWLEGNTIYIGDYWYEKHKSDRLLYKTIVAMEWLLPNYTHFIRTNLNAFINLNAVHEFMKTHHQSFYSTPLWQKSWYAIGYSIMYTADVAAHIVKEYRRLEALEEELISPFHADDEAMAALATGVWPYNKQHPFRCCPTLPRGVRQLMCFNSLSNERLNAYAVLLTPPITLEAALKYCKKASKTTMLYRIKGGLSLSEVGRLYDFLLHKHYPNLMVESLVDYAQSFHAIN